MNKIQRLQNKAIKVIFGLNYYTRSEDIYKQYPFLNLQSLKLLEQAKLVYNIKNKLLKTNTQVSSTGEHHEYNVRNKNLLRNKYARSKKGQDSPIYRSIQAYNSIPKSILKGHSRKLCHNLKKYIRCRN